jgi:probable HAF family extracellular repeat protein
MLGFHSKGSPEADHVSRQAHLTCPVARRCSIGYGINDAGDVVGMSAYASAGDGHAFLYSGGAMISLGTLGGFYSSAYGVNNHGQVVGVAEIAPRETRAFLYQNGAMLDLNTLIDPNSGWVLSGASAINDAG